MQRPKSDHERSLSSDFVFYQYEIWSLFTLETKEVTQKYQD